MADVLKLIWWTIVRPFRSRASLEAEIPTLRQQLNVLHRKSPKRIAFKTRPLMDCHSPHVIQGDFLPAAVILRNASADTTREYCGYLSCNISFESSVLVEAIASEMAKIR
jgi:hypothetical protein